MSTVTKISKAMSQLVLHWPFFGSIGLRLKMVESNAILTMATDGRSIYYNTQFTESLSQDELIGVLVHEILHVTMLHPLREKSREHHRWNIACDLAINPIIIDNGLTLPKDRLLDSKYKGWPAEKIYNDLPETKTITVCVWGGVDSPKDQGGQALSDADMSDLEEDIKQMILQAAAVAKSRGKIPAGIEGLIEQAKEAKVDWRDVLRSHIGGARPDDYTWARPNRKMIGAHDLYMPSAQRFGVGTVAVAIDTSGSVSDQELQQFLGELNSIIDDTGPDRVIVMQCDAKLQDVTEYQAGEHIEKFKVKGRGGTAFRPPFEYIDLDGIRPDSFVYLTDLECYDFPLAPDYPVLWISTGASQAPFGQVVKMAID